MRTDCKICRRSFLANGNNCKTCGEDCRKEMTDKRNALYRERNRQKARDYTRAWYKDHGSRKATWGDKTCEYLAGKWDKCRNMTDEEREELIRKCRQTT